MTCGYVLEHLPDARSGLSELARVLTPGGRMLLITTEDNFGGAWTSRVWYCRTYNRQEVLDTSRAVGLDVHRELWFSRMHKLLRAGGICLDLRNLAGSAWTCARAVNRASRLVLAACSESFRARCSALQRSR